MRSSKLLSAVLLLVTALSCDNDVDMSSSEGTGQGGSMTRFAISGNYLYVVDQQAILVFGIVDGSFTKVREVSVGFGMETIFAKGDYLYLGANDAMYIYSIADPSHPSFIFRYQHIVSCDPVVVQGNRAYVTLRSGNLCNRGANALEIIDISNPLAPVLIENYPMSAPHGLGVDGNLLFLCEGEFGLKVFDLTDENQIALVEHRDDFFAYDVIVREGIATVTGEDGIFQFSYGESEGELTLLSTIPVLRADL